MVCCWKERKRKEQTPSLSDWLCSGHVMMQLKAWVECLKKESMDLEQH